MMTKCCMISSQSKVIRATTTTIWDVATQGSPAIVNEFTWITWAKCYRPARKTNGPPDPNEFTTEEARVTCEDCLAALAEAVINDRKAAVIT